MEIINYIIAVPLGVIALFFLSTGWQRGLRFRFHDYQGDQKESRRDNFFSSFNVFTGLCCFVPIFTPVRLWSGIIPITLLIIFVGTPLAMLGASLSSLSPNSMARQIIRNNKTYGQSINEGSTKWHEFTPFAFVTGWLIYYLVYVILMWTAGKEIMSDTVPVWVVIVGLVLGMIGAVLLAIGIYRKFKDA